MFLDRVERIDLDNPVAQRRRLVENLATLPLSDSEVTAARDVCVDAHRAILEAEDRHADAAALVARHGTSPPAAIHLRVERALDEGDRALARSRDLFSRCHRESRELDARYRRHRR